MHYGPLWIDNEPPEEFTITCTNHVHEVWDADVTTRCSWEQVGGPSPVTYQYCIDESGCTWADIDGIGGDGRPYKDLTFDHEGVWDLVVRASDTGGDPRCALHLQNRFLQADATGDRLHRLCQQHLG